MTERNEQTICAISTAHGIGGIAVIRVSGKEALSICTRYSPALLKKKSVESHRAYFSSFTDAKNEKIDEVVLTYFAEGKSFTGEQTVEISCHGSPFISSQILETLVGGGARIADPGEFTYRAFMNGRIDLVQAESVLALIESQSRDSAKLALRQLEGRVSEKFEAAVGDLTWCLAHIEASIDFIEQGIEVVDVSDLLKRLTAIKSSLQGILQTYESGRLLRDGARVVLVGEPNAGKSSLLNMLSMSDRAIVTPIAGTTRDVIDCEIVYGGRKLNLVDTAGLRESKDVVEVIGIDRSMKEAGKADLICLVFDAGSGDWERTLQLADQHGTSRKLAIVNKVDLFSGFDEGRLRQRLGVGVPVIAVSATDDASRPRLLDEILKSLGSIQGAESAAISTARQYEQTKEAFEMISKSVDEMAAGLGAEFVAMSLKGALISLQKILGQVYDDQIMDRVFKEFCLGK